MHPIFEAISLAFGSLWDGGGVWTWPSQGPETSVTACQSSSCRSFTLLSLCLSSSLPTLAWIPRTGRWWCIMIWFTRFYCWNWNSARFYLIICFVLFASSVPMDWHITALVSTDGDATGELATTQSSTSGMVLPAVGIACLGAILFGYHLGYFYSAPNSCT